jgi:hypothetical protein
MKTMKKLISLVAAMSLIASSTALTAFADDTTDTAPTTEERVADGIAVFER